MKFRLELGRAGVGWFVMAKEKASFGNVLYSLADSISASPSAYYARKREGSFSERFY
jgi:hypothetical protein